MHIDRGSAIIGRDLPGDLSTPRTALALGPAAMVIERPPPPSSQLDAACPAPPSKYPAIVEDEAEVTP